VSKFSEVTSELEKLYTAKNSDYGNSFDKLMDEFGDLSLVLRLCDKVERLKMLLKKEAQVKDERFIDTVRDMVNYGIMWLMRQIKEDKQENKWNFPETIFTKNNSLKQQISHLESEIIEVKNAYLSEGFSSHMVEELWDVIHSAETALRILGTDKIDIFYIKDKVIEKNKERGYYNLGDDNNV